MSFIGEYYINGNTFSGDINADENSIWNLSTLQFWNTEGNPAILNVSPDGSQLLYNGLPVSGGGGGGIATITSNNNSLTVTQNDTSANIEINPNYQYSQLALPGGVIDTVGTVLTFQPNNGGISSILTSLSSTTANISIIQNGNSANLTLNTTINGITDFNADMGIFNQVTSKQLKFLDIDEPGPAFDQWRIQSENTILTTIFNQEPSQAVPLYLSSINDNIKLDFEGNSVNFRLNNSIAGLTSLTSQNINAVQTLTTNINITSNLKLLDTSEGYNEAFITLTDGILNYQFNDQAVAPFPLIFESETIAINQVGNTVQLSVTPEIYPLAEVLAAGNNPGDANNLNITNLNQLQITGPELILQNAFPSFNFQYGINEAIVNTGQQCGYSFVSQTNEQNFGGFFLKFQGSQNGGTDYTFYNGAPGANGFGATPGVNPNEFSLFAGGYRLLRANPSGQFLISQPVREGGGAILDTLTNQPIINAGSGIQVSKNATATSLTYTISNTGQYIETIGAGPNIQIGSSGQNYTIQVTENLTNIGSIGCNNLLIPSDIAQANLTWNGNEGGAGAPLIALKASDAPAAFDPILQVPGLQVVPQFNQIDAATVLLSYGGSLEPNAISNFNAAGLFLSAKADGSNIASLYIDGCAPGGQIPDANIYLLQNSNGRVFINDLNLSGQIINPDGPVEVGGNLVITGTVVSNSGISQKLGGSIAEPVFSQSRYPGIDSVPRSKLSGGYILPTEQELLVAAWGLNKGRRFIISNTNDEYVLNLYEDFPTPTVENTSISFLCDPQAPAITVKFKIDPNTIFEVLRGETVTFTYASGSWQYFGF